MRAYRGGQWLAVLVAAAAFGKMLAADETAAPLETIGDITVVSGMTGIPVEGWGLVVGLPGTGSNPPPSRARHRLLDMMRKRNVPTPEALLRSRATALVRVTGVIPPGARKGERINVRVELLPQDQAKSLRRGWLLETELFESGVTFGVGGLSGEKLGMAAGPLVVQGEEAEARWAVIPGGGVCLVNRSFSLLTGNNYRSARYTMEIERRINQRFPVAGPGRKQVATAKDDTQIELVVPTQYEFNPARFLTVVRAIPLWSRNHTDEAIAERIQRLAKDLQNPATALPAAIALESIGRRGIPALKAALNSPNPDVRFFAAEALAYLGEPAAAHALAETARQIREYRAHALTALASLDEPASRLELRRLLDARDTELRYGAFRALRMQDTLSPDMKGRLLDRHVRLHVLNTAGPPLVHVTLQGEPEIVIFGEDQRFLTPLTLRAGTDILLTASTGARTMLVARYTLGQRPVRRSVPLELVPAIEELVQLGARYSDLVQLFELAHKNHNLQGEFAVDAVPDPGLLNQRLKRIAAPEVAETGVSSPLVGLFRRAKQERTRRGPTATASLDAERSDDDPRYFRSEPGFWKRIWKRLRR